MDEQFTVDSDSKAEWAINQIKEQYTERDRLIKVCDEQIEIYNLKKEEYQKKCEDKTSYLKSMLQQYFATVEHKSTKTQESYELPSGKLRLKYPKEKFKIDDSKLLEWLKDNARIEYIETKVSPKWGEFKKAVAVVGNKVVTEEGQVVEGVAVEMTEPEFVVEV